MRTTRIVSACLSAIVACGAIAGIGPTYLLTQNPADVPGPAIDFGALPPTLTAFFDGTRIGAGAESARDYNFMGTPIAMGYRAPGEDEIRNTYFPGVATSLVFRFDEPVGAAGAFLRGVATAGINPSYGVNVAVRDEFGFEFSQFVEFPEGPTGAVFVGVVSSDASIVEIEFSPPSIGGIACSDLRPGGPALGPCVGDTNGDRVVDFADLNIVLTDYGSFGPGLQGDLDGDHDCDFEDLNIVLSAYGTVC